MAKGEGKPATFLARGINSLGRSQSYKRQNLYGLKKKNGGKFPVHPKKEKAPVAASKPARFYPADDVPKPLAKKVIRNSTRLRPSVTPGTVLILLSGRFKGKRVVFLRQQPSGLLLVTGPFKLNGVPVRRVNQAYVIATSTKVELPSLDLSVYTDSYFKGLESKDRSKDKDAAAPTKKELPADYVSNQKSLDAALLPAIGDELKGYLSTRFTLRDGDRPHLLKF